MGVTTERRKEKILSDGSEKAKSFENNKENY
jgi:hypothetical protein